MTRQLLQWRLTRRKLTIPAFDINDAEGITGFIERDSCKGRGNNKGGISMIKVAVLTMSDKGSRESVLMRAGN